MNRYPERVPFRLTRMLVKAMEVSGIEVSYQSTCERTMSVLRGSRDSLVAMLEAFVYDPLISWRLVDLSPGGSAAKLSNNVQTTSHPGPGVPIGMSERHSLINHPIDENLNEEGGDGWPNDAEGHSTASVSQHHSVAQGAVAISTTRSRSLQMYNNIQNWAANLDTDNRIASIAGERSEHVAAEGSIAKSRIERSIRHREMLSLLGGDDGAAHEEALNEKALKVIRRVQDKLTGTDFPDFDETSEPLDVPKQVQRLIVQATSSENLCQLFIGWCAMTSSSNFTEPFLVSNFLFFRCLRCAFW